jgi:hypothetical protein
MKFGESFYESFSDDDIRKVLKERNITLPQDTDDTFKTIGDRVKIINTIIYKKDYFIVIERVRDILTIVNPKTKEQIKILSNKVKLK